MYRQNSEKALWGGGGAVAPLPPSGYASDVDMEVYNLIRHNFLTSFKHNEKYIMVTRHFVIIMEMVMMIITTVAFFNSSLLLYDECRPTDKIKII